MTNTLLGGVSGQAVDTVGASAHDLMTLNQCGTYLVIFS